jgi:hypothetical protein
MVASAVGIDHPTICRLIGDIAAEEERRNLGTTRSFDFGDDLMVTTFCKPTGYTMVKLTKASTPDIGTFIQVAGGGAKSVPASGELCQAIFERHRKFDWGGPFVRAWPIGTMTYGSQMVVPAEALAMDGKGLGFLGAMIDLLGQMAHSIAIELVPHFGGVLLDGSGTDDENDLFTALLSE